jgi:membrane-associated phospholipid phosphatase
MRILAIVVLAAACATTPQPRGTALPTPTPLDGLGTNLADAFSGANLVYFAGAIWGTGVLALSGADHEVHVHFNRHIENTGWNETGNIAGYVVPLLTAPTIYMAGLASGDRTLTGAGSAAIQAFVVTVATTGALKVAIGRPFPQMDGELDPDRARKFSPFQNGIGSWPSGHTSGTIAIAAALTAYAPEQKWIPLVGYPLALGIGVAMVDRGSHWASDVVAGALIGHAIGYTIGRNFRNQVRGKQTVADSIAVGPLSGGAGVALSGRW